MRFLLNAATAAAASKPLGASAAMQVTKGTAGTSAAAAAASAAAVTTSRAVAAAGGGVSIPRHLQQHPRLQKSWGQQCSPNCGCVVRYETVVDEATDRIVDVTYHAKSVLLSASGSDDSSLVPQLTQTPDTNSTDSTKGRPILTECRCPTVHQLSSRITGYLRDRSLQHIYNTVEFSGVRSSPGFRRAVLAENGLGRGSTGCYDLVEEAFVACIKGYMPKPRGAHDAGYSSSPFPSAMPQHYVDDCEFDNDNDDDSTYETDEGRRMLVDKAADEINTDDATTVADHPSRGLALNPTRYADAARRAGKAFPPSYGNGTMNVYKANDPVSNMPSYSLLAGDQSENKGSAYMYRPRATVGIGGGGSSGDGMPAFHISEEELNELEKRYDYELDDLREVQGYLVAADGNTGRRKAAATDDEERALLLSDWQAYVDGEMNKNDDTCTNNEEAS